MNVILPCSSNSARWNLVVSIALLIDLDIMVKRTLSPFFATMVTTKTSKDTLYYGTIFVDMRGSQSLAPLFLAHT
jgi:hypothetical protein